MNQLTINYITSEKPKAEINGEFRMSSLHQTADGHSLNESLWPLQEINYVRAVNSIVAIILQLMKLRQTSTYQAPELSVGYNEDKDSFGMNFLLSASKNAFFVQYYTLLDFFTEVEFAEEKDPAYAKLPEPVLLPEKKAEEMEQIEITFHISNLSEFVNRLQQYVQRNNIPCQEKYGPDSARIGADKTYHMVLKKIVGDHAHEQEKLYLQGLYYMPFATYASAPHAVLTGLGVFNQIHASGIPDSFDRIRGLLKNRKFEDVLYPGILPQ